MPQGPHFIGKSTRRLALVMAMLALTLLSIGQSPATAEMSHHVVWESGTDGYDTYRIPAILRAKSGHLLAFAEGRRHSRGDSGNIDLLMKRSTDGGRTWSDQQVIWDDGPNTCGNPCPVVLEPSGEILLLATHNLGEDHEGLIIEKKSKGTRTVWLMRSGDEGRTWSAPRDITQQTKDPTWGWYATGPGVAIQIQHGPHAGRIVVPANHSYDAPQAQAVRSDKFGFGSHVIFSDDAGRTWRRSRPIRPRVNESQVVELSGGRLMMNMRAYFGDHSRRIALSDNGGWTWTDPRPEPQLGEPVCQASIIRYPGEEADAPATLLFSNPPGNGRENLTVKLSADDGRTWSASRVIGPGPAAYSCLVALDDHQAGCLFETGRAHPYETIQFTRFDLDWLRQGAAR